MSPKTLTWVPNTRGKVYAWTSMGTAVCALAYCALEEVAISAPSVRLFGAALLGAALLAAGFHDAERARGTSKLPEILGPSAWVLGWAGLFFYLLKDYV